MHMLTIDQFDLSEHELEIVTALLRRKPHRGFATTAELEEIWTTFEIPEFEILQTHHTADSGVYFVGTLQIHGVKHMCVAMQNASPLGFFL